MNNEQSSMQLFGTARGCFEENCAVANSKKDQLAFNLNRGLLAFLDAVERELSGIRSDIRRIQR